MPLPSPILALLPFVAILGGAAPADSPAPDPVAFFLGHTEGVGDMKIVMRPAFSMAVHGVGFVAADGAIVVDQIVEEDGQPAHAREWRIRAVGAGRYEGSLTDADGPIAGELDGGRLHLRYRMKNGMAVEQWVAFDDDGRTAHNVLHVRQHGMMLARLNETIRRTGD